MNGRLFLHVLCFACMSFFSLNLQMHLLIRFVEMKSGRLMKPFDSRAMATIAVFAVMMVSCVLMKVSDSGVHRLGRKYTWSIVAGLAHGAIAFWPCFFFMNWFWRSIHPSFKVVGASTVIIWMGFLSPFLIALALTRLIREIHPSSGLCHVCGYDLRASSKRCPECGTAAA